MKILLIKQTSLGDVVHATTSLRSVRIAYPDAEISLLTSATASDIFLNNPDVDKLITFDRYKVDSLWRSQPGWVLSHFRETFAAVRKEKYDAVFDLQGSWKTVIFLWSSRSSKRYVKGKWLFAKRYHRSNVHAIDEMNGVLSLGNIQSRQFLPLLFESEEDRSKISDICKNLPLRDKKVVLFCPFTRWNTKNWPLRNYVDLAELISNEYFIFFTGSEADRAPISAATSSLPKDHFINLAGELSLTNFFALAKIARLVVTGDSFAMHVASAYDTPLVALFGPTDERLVGPRNEKSVVVRQDYQCPCYKRKSCSRDCIGQISITQVRAAISKVTKKL